MKNHIFIYILILVVLSCSDKNDFIRNVYVDIEIPLNQPEFEEITTIGNSMFITGGVRGIIIYHSNVNEYKAYDRNCSFQPSETCSTIDSINSTLAFCECCDSKFLINQSGYPTDGSALLPLKEYYTSLSGNKLRISN